MPEAQELHDKIIRSYLFTLNKGGPTESNLSAQEVDLILLALKHLATQTNGETLMKPLPCPFCGTLPELYPKDPKREGNAFGQVRCEFDNCPAQPCVNDGEGIADERGTKAYQEAAIKRWNKRS